MTATVTPPAEKRAVWQKLIVGAISGLLAGIVYWLLLSSQNMSVMTGRAAGIANEFFVHIAICTALGAGFGLWFDKLAHSPGAGMTWGVVYAMLWWLIGPLTLFPVVMGGRPGWDLPALRDAFSLLAGLVVSYGSILGIVYVIAREISRGRFHLMKARQAALRVLADFGAGGLAGLIGGLAFGAWMEQTGFYPLVAGLVRSDSPEVGRNVHLLISVVIGLFFGLLLRRELRGLGASVVWGMSYGVWWWFVGPLTLMPALLGFGAQWTLNAGKVSFPSLIGHVVYGFILGGVFYLLSQIWKVLLVDSDPLNRQPEGMGTQSLRALGIGTAASVVGGLVFTIVMVGTNALPVVAQLVGQRSEITGFIVHMIISAIIGATYGLLFRREAARPGEAVAWGATYGLLWWFLGPLTLFPALLGLPLEWTIQGATGAYPSLIGHLAYGVALAIAFYWLERRFDPGLRTRAARQRVAIPAGGTPVPGLWITIFVLSILLPLMFA